MPKRTVVTLVVFAIVGVALYFMYPRDSFDPAADASKAISQQIWDELGRDSTIECVQPDDDAVGSSFVCRADVSGGTTLHFDVTIVEGPAVTTALDVSPSAVSG
jgi:hypothetical protein